MNNPAPPSASCAWNFFVCLCKLWWIPLITVTLGVGLAVGIFFHTPPTFMSYGVLWETEKLQIPDAANYSENRENFVGTQSELLRSQKLQQMTLEAMKAFGPNGIVRDEKGTPIPVDIKVSSATNSRVYQIQAISTDPGFTPAYLNTLMQQYLDFRKSSRRGISSETLASISIQVQRLGQAMQTAQEALTAYEKTNNLATLTDDSTFAAAYLVKLKTELADDQLAKMFLDRPSLSEAETTQRQTLQFKIEVLQKFVKEWESKIAADNALIASTEGLKQEVTRNQGMYERLSALVQNVDLNRSIDTETLAILQPASPAKRSYVREKRLLVVGGFSGLGLGLGLIVLLGWSRAGRRNLVPPAPRGSAG